MPDVCHLISSQIWLVPLMVNVGRYYCIHNILCHDQTSIICLYNVDSQLHSQPATTWRSEEKTPFEEALSWKKPVVH